MAPRLDPSPPGEALPPTTDVLIIGGGIIGSMTALFLAREGVKVTLVEKGVVGGEQSGQNWGWCRTAERPFEELPLVLRSLELWAGMADLTGTDVGFKRNGALQLADTPAGLAELTHWANDPRAQQTGVEVLGGNALAQRLPPGSKTYTGGIFTPSEGVAEPQKAAPCWRSNEVPTVGSPALKPNKARSHAALSCLQRGIGQACCAAASASACRN